MAVVSVSSIVIYKSFYMEPGPTHIEEGDNSQTILDKLAVSGANALLEVLDKLQNDTLVLTPQNEEKATFCSKITTEMSKIDWNTKNAFEIKNLVRGLNPIMGTYSFIGGKKVKFWRVQVLSNEVLQETLKDTEYSLDCNPGTIIYANEKVGLFIKAKDAVVSVLEIQGENAKRMNVKDFLRGNKLQKGEIFE